MSFCIDLKGKNAIVTGGYSGIGLSITKTLLTAGAKVAIIGRSYVKFSAISDELSKIKDNAGFSFYEADISDSIGIAKTIADIMLQYGKIDILVNNAGITKDAILIKMSDEDWSEVININLNGLFYVVKNVIKYMIKAKAGKIINISSVIGEFGNAGQANYASAKAGMIAFTKSIAKEYASRNIYVNAVAPGFISTDMTDKLNELIQNNIKKEIPLTRFGVPEDVSNAVLFLASELSDYITGATIDVNGGMHMR